MVGFLVVWVLDLSVDEVVFFGDVGLCWCDVLMLIWVVMVDVVMKFVGVGILFVDFCMVLEMLGLDDV